MSEEMLIQNTLDLRFMQVEFSLQTGSSLPGAKIAENFLNCEFITMLEKSERGVLCFAKLEFEKPEALQEKIPGIEIIEIKSMTKNSTLAKILLNGPVAMMFCEDNDVWWVNPTTLNQAGFAMTVRGTRKGLTRLRESISQLVGNGFSVKLGADSMHSPEFREMLPQKQRLVLYKAIEMGYYSRPRGCTQRDIAEVMNIKQATVSEHLQSAESMIINSIGI